LAQFDTNNGVKLIEGLSQVDTNNGVKQIRALAQEVCKRFFKFIFQKKLKTDYFL